MRVGSLGNLARVIAVLAACAAAAGSATSSSSSNPDPSVGPAGQGPPAPQQMEASRALGLWRSTFGAVKIEPDDSHGGLGAGSVQGVWVYNRQGQEVVGYFSGGLRGNVLQFRWQEPNDPPLTGEGYLVFDAQGRQYSGRWWSDKRDRVGDWNGWRSASRPGAPQPNNGGGAQPYNGDPNAQPYDGQDDGYQQPQPQQPPRRDAYRRGPYQQPSQPPSQQPTNQQPYQQQPDPQTYQQPQQPPPPKYY